MQLYAVNFTPLLGSLYMFRVFYTPNISNVRRTSYCKNLAVKIETTIL